jgi:hypothetical protein
MEFGCAYASNPDAARRARLAELLVLKIRPPWSH